MKRHLYRGFLGLLSLGLVLALLLGPSVPAGASMAAAKAAAIPAPELLSGEISAYPIYGSAVISDALSFIHSKQLENGGIEGWSPGEADEFTTIKTVVALGAARRPAATMTTGGNSSLDYLAAQAISYTHDLTGTLFPGRAGMVTVAVVSGEGDPAAFGGMDLVHELTATYHPQTGAYSTTAEAGFASGAAGTVNQLWALLALAAVQEPAPLSATAFLIELQEPDGGWGWGAGYGDVDTTALVLQALLASGNVPPTHTKVQEGLDFLRLSQAAFGGWEAWGAPSADSTASAIQAVAAAGYRPVAESWARQATPQEALLSMQAPDGSFGGNALGTAHAVAALTETPLPIPGRVQRAGLALGWLNDVQNADGSWSGWAGPDPGVTCDAVLAYVSAGYDPDTVMARGSVTSALAYLESAAADYAPVGPDQAGKLALTVEFAGGNAHDLGGVDLLYVLTDTHYSPTLGGFGTVTNTWHQAYALLGLAAAGESIPPMATQTLLGLQQADGGWKYDLNPAGWNLTTPDSTGLAMQALLAAGMAPTHTSIVSATAFLRAQQDAWAGWGNANSTAYALQGLLAAGQDLIDWWLSGHSPLDALAAYQKPDGAFVWDWAWPADNSLAAAQAVPALLEVWYPRTGPGQVEQSTLLPYAPVYRGLDADRTVAALPRVAWSEGVDVVVPFGSDLDLDGAVSLEWRAVGQGAWMTAVLGRADGYYTATVPITLPAAYEFRATFADGDGVQYGGELAGSVALSVTLQPYQAYLPLAFKHDADS
ncbi:MAG: terpene cyclase/mutase family protein [Chloroflexia bacterium]|nr:terpene cyclase/mutase family protein [Chloroflexia bacterium]